MITVDVNASAVVNDNSGQALIVGGTGMLRGVTLELARRNYIVSVIARNKTRMLDLIYAAQVFGGHIHPIPVDVQDAEALATSLRVAMTMYGPIELVLQWISPNDSLDIAKMVGSPEKPCEYFHVLGSSAADPARADANRERRARFDALSNIRYHEVILGFITEPSGSRWLTHEGICQGVLRAIDQKLPRFVVGTVEPWSARP